MFTIKTTEISHLFLKSEVVNNTGPTFLSGSICLVLLKGLFHLPHSLTLLSGPPILLCSLMLPAEYFLFLKSLQILKPMMIPAGLAYCQLEPFRESAQNFMHPNVPQYSSLIIRGYLLSAPLGINRKAMK